MHRTYSMRSSRAPTASELQTPPPPASSTKHGRLFKGNLGETCSQLSVDTTLEAIMSAPFETASPPSSVSRRMSLIRDVKPAHATKRKGSLKKSCWIYSHYQ